MAAPRLDDDHLTPPEGDDDTRRATGFWAKRSLFEHIWHYAKHRRRNPWAVFGGILVNTSAQIPARVWLPAEFGNELSLNVLVALYGKSGIGKDSATAAARTALTYDGAGWEETRYLPIGTGEGIARKFSITFDEDGKPGEPELTSVASADFVMLTFGCSGHSTSTDALEEPPSVATASPCASPRVRFAVFSNEPPQNSSPSETVTETVIVADPLPVTSPEHEMLFPVASQSRAADVTSMTSNAEGTSSVTVTDLLASNVLVTVIV